MAWETKRSCPRMRCHLLRAMRLTPASSVKMVARVCLRCAGSSRVCRTKSMVQPRMTLREFQLPSPRDIFLTDAGSRMFPEASSGCEIMPSMAWSRWSLRLFIRRVPPCPTWMKSSTKTSVTPTGRWNGRLEGGAMWSGSGRRATTPGTDASASSALMSSGDLGAGEDELTSSSMDWASEDRRWGSALSGWAWNRVLATSQMVSDMAENVGGDSTQPMVQASGMPIS